MTSTLSLLDRAGLDRDRGPPPSRPRPRRRRRRRAVPRISPVRDAGVRQRPAQAGDLRHRPGFRAARRQGRGGRLCPRLRPVRAAVARAAEAVRAVKGGYSGQLCGGAGAHQCAALWRREPARRADLRDQGEAAARRSTPMRAPRTRACGRSRSRFGASWQVVEILRADGDDLSRRAPAGARQRLGGRRRRRPPGDRAATAMAGAKASTRSSTRRNGSTRSTRRCARRWSISKRCRRRPARWTSCSAPAGPA